MTDYKFGDIVLLSFPFTNGISAKKRPALVLLDANDNDVVVVRITSQFSDTDFDLPIRDWQKAGLLSLSYLRFHKIATLEKTLIDKKLGYLSMTDLQKAKDKIQEIINEF